MHFRHISAKILLKNLKQHFDWGGGEFVLSNAKPSETSALITAYKLSQKCGQMIILEFPYNCITKQVLYI